MVASFNEDYFLEKSRKAATVYEAKSYIRMGTLQYPRSFRLEYEGYKLSKLHNDSHEAARSMGDLVRKFGKQPELTAEIKRILEAVKSRVISTPDAVSVVLGDKTADEEAFLCRIFEQLDEEVQQDILEAELNEVIAEESKKDTDAAEDYSPDFLLVNKCFLLYVLIKRVPEAAASRAMRFYEILSSVKLNQDEFVPLSVERALVVFRRALVGEVLPLVVTSKEALPSWEHLAEALKTAIEFSVPFICEEIVVHRALRPTSYFEEARADGYKTAWQKLVALLHLVVKRLERGLKASSWFSSSSSVEAILAKIQNLANSEKLGTALGQQLACCSSVLLVRCLLEYGSAVSPLSSGGGKTSAILVQAVSNPAPWPTVLLDLGGRCQRAKKLSDGTSLFLSPLIDAIDPATLFSSFVNLKTGFALARSHGVISQAFDKVWSRISWDPVVSPLYKSVVADVAIAEGRLEDALQLLRTRRIAMLEDEGSRQGGGDRDYYDDATSFSPEDVASIGVRGASCLYSLGLRGDAVAELIDSFLFLWQKAREANNLAEPSSRASASSSSWFCEAGEMDGSGTPRSLCFISAQVYDLAKYTVGAIVEAIQPMALKEDKAFGHLMVLLQLDWPLDEGLFLDGYKRIKTKGSFDYPLFADYIVEKYFFEAFLSLGFSMDLGFPAQTNLKDALVKKIQAKRPNRLELIAKFLKKQRKDLVSLCGGTSDKASQLWR